MPELSETERSLLFHSTAMCSTQKPPLATDGEGADIAAHHPAINPSMCVRTCVCV